MKALILCLGLIFYATSGIYAQQTNVELPDYIKWVMQLDHSEGYLYKDRNIQLRDQHYIFEQATSKQLVLIYYKPEDNNKEWFAIWMTLDTAGNLSGSLFERNDTVWSFVQNLSRDDLDDMTVVFKSRYDLINK